MILLPCLVVGLSVWGSFKLGELYYRHFNETMRPNRYRIVQTGPAEFTIQNSFKSWYGWSRWGGYLTRPTLDSAIERARGLADERLIDRDRRLAKYGGPVVVAELGILPPGGNDAGK